MDSPNAWKGNLRAIHSDLDKSIRKCFSQAKKAREAYENGTLKLPFEDRPNHFLTVIVTDESFPNLLLDVLRGDYLTNVVGEEAYPYIISARDLEKILKRVNAKKFFEFVLERISMTGAEGGGHILCADEWDYLKLFLRPDYGVIRQTLIERKADVGFTPKPDLPPRKDRLEILYFIIESVGGGGCRIMNVTSPKNIDWGVEMAMRFCYEAYKNWDEVLPHMVFDIEQFNAAVARCKQRGIRCRAIGWEGMYDYLETTDTPEVREFKRKLTDESIADDVATLLPIELELPSSLKRGQNIDDRIGDLMFDTKFSRETL